jgi:hypothetical protein
VLQQCVADQATAEPGQDGQRDESDGIHPQLASDDTAEHGIAEDPEEVDDPEDLTDRVGHGQ